MRALSIRQPYAELILRGIKTVEYRTRPTRIIAERFHIYASKGHSSLVGFDKLTAGTGHLSDFGELSRAGKKAWSKDLTGQQPPDWMVELAEQVGMIEPDALLPTGVIVGSAVIEKVSRVDSMYAWHLAGVERLTKPRRPKGHPQPVWFQPF
jgi:predicted transcriptional regulator